MSLRCWLLLTVTGLTAGCGRMESDAPGKPAADSRPSAPACCPGAPLVNSQESRTMPSCPSGGAVPLPASDEHWRRILTTEQYRVARQKGTEPAFSGEYCTTDKEGTYRCSCCGAPLFSSQTKYHSGCGWPSFYAPMDADCIKTQVDDSLGMRRIEVLCRRCEAHLGHVFDDGPQPTGLRYCINSVCLKLDPSQGTPGRGEQPAKP